MTPKKAIELLEEAAKYFEKRPIGGEDKAHWSNIYNAKNCREIADLIRSNEKEKIPKTEGVQINVWWATIILAFVKLAGILDISWWVVFAPIWVTYIFILLTFLMLGVIHFIVDKAENKER